MLPKDLDLPLKKLLKLLKTCYIEEAWMIKTFTALLIHFKLLVFAIDVQPNNHMAE